MKLNGDTNFADTAKDALRLLEWFLMTKIDGKKMLIADGDTVKEVELNL